MSNARGLPALPLPPPPPSWSKPLIGALISAYCGKEIEFTSDLRLFVSVLSEFKSIRCVGDITQ